MMSSSSWSRSMTHSRCFLIQNRCKGPRLFDPSPWTQRFPLDLALQQSQETFLENLVLLRLLLCLRFQTFIFSS